MVNGAKTKVRLKTKFKNDETFGSLDLKTLVYIVLTLTLFQLSENVSSVFTYIAVGAMLLGLIVIESDQIAFAYIVLAASNRLLNVGDNIPLLPIVTIVYFAREYLFNKSYKKRGFDTGLGGILAVYFLYSMRYFFSNYSLGAVTMTAKLFFMFTMLVDVFKKCETKDQIRIRFNQMTFYMSLGLTVTVLISLLFSSTGGVSGRFSISTNSGANVLGVYVSSTIAASIMVIMSDNSLFTKKIMAVLTVPMAYVGLLTQSRTFVVLFLIIIVWFLVMGFGNENSKKQTGIFLAAAIVVSVLFVFLGKKTELYSLFETILERFIHPRNDDISAGRTHLARVYLEATFSSISTALFGAKGSFTSPGGGIMAHNMYIEVLYGHGLVGFGIVTAMYVIFFKRIAESFKKQGFSGSLEGALPFVLCLVGGLSSHTILGAMPTNEFFVGVCAMYYYSNSSEKSLGKRLRRRKKNGLYSMQTR